MRALSIRQPYAELILRGIKTVEYRSRPTRIIGERFHIYAAKKSAVGSGQWAGKTWSRDLAVVGAGDALPDWMIELAEQVGMIEAGALLPTSVIVGSAIIEKVTRNHDLFEWHLAGIERARRFRKPHGHPQPVWFHPFD
jgi:predicted transcriptional regulator